ncbi:Helix-turn-helix domain [Alistipes finegoldii]|nr:Helix-turn-helix domain [Alistipes finegoldii]
MHSSMTEEIITRDSSAFKELRRNILRAIQAVDILIDTHRPAIGNEIYLTSEEMCSIFGISKRSLQNYRDNRQIPYTSIGGKILYPLSAIYKLLESRYVRALR